jgi:N-methylhydantoinase A
METRARRILQPSAPGDLLVIRTADMRYVGQGFQISVPLPGDVLGPAHEEQIRDTFVTTYHQVFGRVIRDGTPEFVSWRLSASTPPAAISLIYWPSPAKPGRRRRPVHFAGTGAIDVAVYDRYMLTPGTTIAGPALFEERETSCSVGSDCTVTVDSHRNLIIDIGSRGREGKLS